MSGDKVKKMGLRCDLSSRNLFAVQSVIVFQVQEYYAHNTILTRILEFHNKYDTVRFNIKLTKDFKLLILFTIPYFRRRNIYHFCTL